MSRSRAIAERVVENWLGGAVQWRGQAGTAASAAPAANVTYDNRLQVYPREATFSTAQLQREQQRQEVRARVGRDN
ncbi:hypothetical protein O7635_27870 [Asanoa sp. WMMD1127]|uniref:hypothetical protein n=1 Tax=Asanoa sp. WMMD1127 TaxID=3016107 RepID=UPI0024159D44|nr:hypothetical protein [Asanoa sp. WMMD1127]MDG4825681.1 hypothetical protein [Asanoa sp. WMMD1127]